MKKLFLGLSLLFVMSANCMQQEPVEPNKPTCPFVELAEGEFQYKRVLSRAGGSVEITNIFHRILNESRDPVWSKFGENGEVDSVTPTMAKMLERELRAYLAGLASAPQPIQQDDSDHDFDMISSGAQYHGPADALDELDGSWADVSGQGFVPGSVNAKSSKSMLFKDTNDLFGCITEIKNSFRPVEGGVPRKRMASEIVSPIAAKRPRVDFAGVAEQGPADAIEEVGGPEVVIQAPAPAPAQAPVQVQGQGNGANQAVGQVQADWYKTFRAVNKFFEDSKPQGSDAKGH